MQTKDPEQPHKNTHLVKGTSVVASLTLLSRVFGFIRDLLVARLFGASAIADCFYVAFRIPNLLRSFVAEGALSAAFVPIFAEELKKGRDRAQTVISLVIGFINIVTLILTILGIIFAKEIIQVIAPGFLEKNTAGLCISLTRIMMPYIVFVSLVAMLNGALNSVNIFGIAAAAQVAMNLTLIAGAILAGLFNDTSGANILAYSVLAGGIVQVLIQIPALNKAGFKFKPKYRIFSDTIKDLLKLMLPAVLGATVYQISQFINTLFASLLSTGSVSWLFYADRLTQLPIGIFSVALASVLLPTLAKVNSEKDNFLFHKHLLDSLRYTSFIIIPTAGIIFYFSDTLISLMFERGHFTHQDTLNTGMAVKAYALGLWTVSSHSMLSRAFIAKRDTITPTIIGIFSLLISITLSLVFMGSITLNSSNVIAALFHNVQGYISQFLPLRNYGHAGLALSASLASFFSFTSLAIILNAKNKTIDWSPFIIATIKTLLSTITAIYLSNFLYLQKFNHLTNSVAQLFLSLALFVVISLLLRTRETSDITHLIRRKIKSNKSHGI